MDERSFEGLIMNLEGSRSFFGKITGALVERICNLEGGRG
jgi:hypothetical protein